MMAGLPGTGLGGLFYVLASLVVLIHGSISRLAGKTYRADARMLARLALMTLGILVAVSLTYWLLAQVLAASNLAAVSNAVPASGAVPAGNALAGAPASLNGAEAPAAGSFHALALPPIFIATLPVQIGSLAALLCSVEIFRWVVQRRVK